MCSIRLWNWSTRIHSPNNNPDSKVIFQLPFSVVLKRSVTQHPLWERSISIPRWWGDVCVYLSLCLCVCLVSFTRYCKLCRQAGHFKGRQPCYSWWRGFGWTAEDEWNVYICVHAFLCVAPHNVHMHIECAHDVRAKTCADLSAVHSFPIAALDQRAWVKPWTWSNGVWKNLSRNNYNLSKYHACSSGPRQWTDEPGQGTFFMWSLWERRSRSNKAWLGTLTPFLLWVEL